VDSLTAKNMELEVNLANMTEKAANLEEELL
jgi:hypothetical protein